MTKSIFTLLILSASFTAGCASNSTEERYAADDCETIGTLFKDQNMIMPASANAQPYDSKLAAEASKDKFTWPWGKGGWDEDKVSKERAALRQAHNRKGCAP